VIWFQQNITVTHSARKESEEEEEETPLVLDDDDSEEIMVDLNTESHSDVAPATPVPSTSMATRIQTWSKTRGKGGKR
jgi:hypothetical protein